MTVDTRELTQPEPQTLVPACRQELTIEEFPAQVARVD